MIRTPLDYLLLALAGSAFVTALALSQVPAAGDAGPSAPAAAVQPLKT